MLLCCDLLTFLIFSGDSTVNALWGLSSFVLLFCKQIISTSLISRVKFSFPLYSFEFGAKCRCYLRRNGSNWDPPKARAQKRRTWLVKHSLIDPWIKRPHKTTFNCFLWRQSITQVKRDKIHLKRCYNTNWTFMLRRRRKTEDLCFQIIAKNNLMTSKAVSAEVRF